MATGTFQLSGMQVEALKSAEGETRDGGMRRRLQGVRLYGTGMAMQLVMEVVGAGESTVREWVTHYRQAGVEGLRSQWQGRNANKLNDAQRGELKARLEQYRPADIQVTGGLYWTVSDLRIAVQQWFGVTYKAIDSYHHLLHESGLSYQRAAKVYRNKPSAAAMADWQATAEKK